MNKNYATIVGHCSATLYLGYTKGQLFNEIHKKYMQLQIPQSRVLHLTRYYKPLTQKNNADDKKCWIEVDFRVTKVNRVDTHPITSPRDE